MEGRLFLNYPEWQDTADTLHLLLQMGGKVKLARSIDPFKWRHLRLYLTPDGLTTGLIPGDRSPFYILYNFRRHFVLLRNLMDETASIPLQNGLSVARFYRHLNRSLEAIGSPTTIDTAPGSFYNPLPFDRDTRHCAYNRSAVGIWFKNLSFASSALTRFLKPYRHSIHYPAYYYSTMKLSCYLFYGLPDTSGGDMVLEQALEWGFYELGFYPGDIRLPDSAFFRISCPPAREGKLLKSARPGKDSLLTLREIYTAPDPVQSVIAFGRAGLAPLRPEA
ncbi:MAG: DUF5996 family protein [Culturomica sp.]|jgi:hypothetical protein|nr:DUF5996 family protein [Culturomica sp.]